MWTQRERCLSQCVEHYEHGRERDDGLGTKMPRRQSRRTSRGRRRFRGSKSQRRRSRRHLSVGRYRAQSPPSGPSTPSVFYTALVNRESIPRAGPSRKRPLKETDFADFEDVEIFARKLPSSGQPDYVWEPPTREPLLTQFASYISKGRAVERTPNDTLISIFGITPLVKITYHKDNVDRPSLYIPTSNPNIIISSPKELGTRLNFGKHPPQQETLEIIESPKAKELDVVGRRKPTNQMEEYLSSQAKVKYVRQDRQNEILVRFVPKGYDDDLLASRLPDFNEDDLAEFEQDG